MYQALSLLMSLKGNSFGASYSENITCSPLRKPQVKSIPITSATQPPFYYTLINLSSNGHIWLVARFRHVEEPKSRQVRL